MSDAAFWRGRDDAGEWSIAGLNADLDRIFGLLAHPRRRALLHLLHDADANPVWTTNLAVDLARIETDGGADVEDAAEDIALTLRHNHLPKLADVGIVDVDATMTTLTYEGDDRLEDLLRWCRSREDEQSLLHSE